MCWAKGAQSFNNDSHVDLEQVSAKYQQIFQSTQRSMFNLFSIRFIRSLERSPQQFIQGSTMQKIYEINYDRFNSNNFLPITPQLEDSTI
ncbi:hypothetical protein H6G00_11345 [Leptolyngbya sp. FACHB-541]|uniref:hypothetical protein n=1 Tax=Leptolyngbya sp. FACHB-541 TaxID=2692810 RepID=UPI0016876FA3|nr:hypothetical protein [Leptolyngbya sp. FACHB-541]MBD1997214.1 hypothetical protein [Leptolyngbya sp. FACHB-541]